MQGIEPSPPVVKVERVQLQFSISSDFVAAQVANNVLVLALATGRILRIDLDSPSDIDGRLGASSQYRRLNQDIQISIYLRKHLRLV